MSCSANKRTGGGDILRVSPLLLHLLRATNATHRFAPACGKKRRAAGFPWSQRHAVRVRVQNSGITLTAPSSPQMNSGFEALPPRAGGRHAAKRRRADTGGRSDGGEAPGAAATGSSTAERGTGASLGIEIDSAEGNYEYLDHTADVQIHGCEWVGLSGLEAGAAASGRTGAYGQWRRCCAHAQVPVLSLLPSPLSHVSFPHTSTGGDTCAEAFGQVACGMWGYMTEPEAVEVGGEGAAERVIDASGHDAINLLFSFLDNCLFALRQTTSCAAR
jgi:hypothetical protein